MGQKVHPHGLRLGVVYNWSSRWYFSNKKAYRQALIEDTRIREELMKKYTYAGITEVVIERAIKKITVTIFSVKPGMIIGRGGKGLEEVKAIITLHMKSLNTDKKTKIDLKIEPVKKPYTNAYYVAQTIAEKLVRNLPHRAVVHSTMARVMEAGVKGVKVQLGGRIQGAEISRIEKYFQGSIPTS